MLLIQYIKWQIWILTLLDKNIKLTSDGFSRCFKKLKHTSLKLNWIMHWTDFSFFLDIIFNALNCRKISGKDPMCRIKGLRSLNLTSKSPESQQVWKPVDMKWWYLPGPQAWEREVIEDVTSQVYYLPVCYAQ